MLIPNLPKGVTLVAATKSQPTETILGVINKGVSHIGENYVQEAEKKFDRIQNKATWHLIGHLQKNKVKKAVRIFDVIQSVDSFELAKRINDECENIHKRIDVMIEVNIGSEESKNGVDPEECMVLIDQVKNLQNLNLIGLMTMCPRGYFRKMNELFTRTGLRFLSMGMSSDYEEAIKNGSNMVRLGTIIFGERK